MTARERAARRWRAVPREEPDEEVVARAFSALVRRMVGLDLAQLEEVAELVTRLERPGRAP